ncbi:MAG: DUF1634 domain-containing protein [Thermoplasmata archaeon]|nr:DUF1634 domain-containing protein [Thermoplasmata archaeon]
MSDVGNGASPEPVVMTAMRRRGRAEEENLPPRLRGLVTKLLRIGVGATAILMISGLVLLFLGGRSASSVLNVIPRRLGAELLAGNPLAVLYAGVLVLLATPLVRVTVSAGLFAHAGDRAFTGITLLVLALLALSILVGYVV